MQRINDCLREMEEQIEKTRLKLHDIMNKNEHNLCNPCIIRCSQLLDELILDYMKALRTKNKNICKDTALLYKKLQLIRV